MGLWWGLGLYGDWGFIWEWYYGDMSYMGLGYMEVIVTTNPNNPNNSKNPNNSTNPKKFNNPNDPNNPNNPKNPNVNNSNNVTER
jgi:hypothetical protein